MTRQIIPSPRVGKRTSNLLGHKSSHIPRTTLSALIEKLLAARQHSSFDLGDENENGNDDELETSIDLNDISSDVDSNDDTKVLVLIPSSSKSVDSVISLHSHRMSLPALARMLLSLSSSH